MSGKQTNLKEQNQHDSDYQSCDSDDTISISEQIQQAIREIPDIYDKVQVVALNYYLQQKRQNDKNLECEKRKLELLTRNSFKSLVEEVQSIIDNQQLSEEDYQFIRNHHHLFDTNLQQIINQSKQLEKTNNPLKGYWLKCFINSDIIAEQIQQKDKQVLSFVYKIEGQKNLEGTKLSVTFYFSPNKWISNQSLTKTFAIDKEGEATKSDGDQIQWKEGMNYTVTVIQTSKKGKKNKNKKKEVIKEPSFFHFFQSIDGNCQNQEQYEDMMDDLQLQFQLSQHLYEDLIPKSLEYYLKCRGHIEYPQLQPATIQANENKQDQQAFE